MLAFLMCLPVRAQEFGALEGVALDENGAVMPGVIIALYAEGHRQATAMTNSDGEYVIKPLRYGKYTLTAHYPNFEKLEMEDVVVHCYRGLAMNLNMAPLTPHFADGNGASPELLAEPVNMVDVTGRVKDAFNRQAEGVQVALYKNSVFWCDATTNAQGNYHIYDVEPGVYVLHTDFNGIKNVRKNVVVQAPSYIKELVAHLNFNKKIINNYGMLVDNGSSRTVLSTEDIVKSPVRP